MSNAATTFGAISIRSLGLLVEIHLTFIGEFSLPTEIELVLTPKETEEQRKLEERREHLHRNYLLRKANGKQQEYAGRYEAGHKARYADRMAALYAEDAVLGTNIVMPFISSAD